MSQILNLLRPPPSAAAVAAIGLAEAHRQLPQSRPAVCVSRRPVAVPRPLSRLGLGESGALGAHGRALEAAAVEMSSLAVVAVAVGCISCSMMAAPPAAPFPWTPNFRHEGAWVGASLESSPLHFKGKLYLMQSTMGPFPRDGSNGSHSFFCIMDGSTGEEISCPPTSTAHAFCSAIVDHTGAGPETAWVFCSAWDRANFTTCPTPMWGCGACALARSNTSECYVGAWSSADLRTWTGPSKILTLPAPVTVPNVAVSMIPPSSQPNLPSSLPKHQAWMALDAPAPPIALNVGTDGNLHRNWQIVPRNYTDGDDNNKRWGGIRECTQLAAATAFTAVGAAGATAALMSPPPQNPMVSGMAWVSSAWQCDTTRWTSTTMHSAEARRSCSPAVRTSGACT